jgi:hypothetical protein
VRNREPSRLAIVEMKLGFSLDLLLQAVDRMRVADEVWLAVPATRRGRDRDPRVRRLCRLLGLGMMAVDIAKDRIEVLAELPSLAPTDRDQINAGARGCSANTCVVAVIRLPAARPGSRS